MAVIAEQSRIEILDAITVLKKRRAVTTDEVEKQEINRAIQKLDLQRKVVEQGDLLNSAIAIAAAADALEDTIASARVKPFGDFPAKISSSVKRLSELIGNIHLRESLPRADVPQEAVIRLAEPEIPDVLPVSSSTKFADLEAEYASCYKACILNRKNQKNVDFYVSRLLHNRPLYGNVAADLGAIPWQFIGIVHGMEAGFDITRHLHNGDPLTGRTVKVPSGRPTTGSPPFEWEASAADALMMQDLHRIEKWSVSRLLYELERYNGFGYRRMGMRTPYLWSFSNLYTKGRYVRDHEFDPDAVSKQCGAALMLQALEKKSLGV